MSDVPWRDLKYSRFYVRSVYCSWKKSDLNQNGCEIVQATVTPESRSFPPGQPTSGVSLWAEFPCTCPLERTVQYFELFPARLYCPLSTAICACVHSVEAASYFSKSDLGCYLYTLIVTHAQHESPIKIAYIQTRTAYRYNALLAVR